MCKLLRISALRVVIGKKSLVISHFSKNCKQIKLILIYKLLIINILYTSSFLRHRNHLKNYK